MNGIPWSIWDFSLRSSMLSFTVYNHVRDKAYGLWKLACKTIDSWTKQEFWKRGALYKIMNWKIKYTLQKILNIDGSERFGDWIHNVCGVKKTQAKILISSNSSLLVATVRDKAKSFLSTVKNFKCKCQRIVQIEIHEL